MERLTWLIHPDGTPVYRCEQVESLRGQLPGAGHPGTACSPPLPPHKEVTQIDSELC